MRGRVGAIYCCALLLGCVERPTAFSPDDPADPADPDGLDDCDDPETSEPLPPDLPPEEERPRTDLANGEDCEENEECRSGACFDQGIFGARCGECLDDADCEDGGCSSPSLDESEVSLCNAGDYASGCQTDDACAEGLVCSTVLDVPGLFVIRGCGECSRDWQCPGGELCVHELDLFAQSGAGECIAPGSRAVGEFCELGASGDDACASAICTPANVDGFFEVGVCGACRTDADCGGGWCREAEVDVEDWVGTGAHCSAE